MKYFILFMGLVLLSANQVFASCLFGDHLIQTARMKDLNFSKERIVTIKSVLTAKEEKQILVGTETNSLENAFDSTDDGEFWIRSVEDTAHQRSFTLFVYSSGDNIQGFFSSDSDDSVVAKVGDGEVYDCKVSYSNYDDLQWFYTN
jgi:hypothetical protein